jgi:pimeloyl-ACP methyl ester carboxylesterase
MAVNHVRRGRGEPLVLLHGLGSRWQVWEPVLDDLTRRYEVIALDLPGFGASPPSGAATVAEFADEVAGFVAGLGLERPAYGGSSLGGGIALELGSRGSARAVTVFSPVGFFGRSGAAWCRTVTGAARSAASCLSPALPALMATAAGRIALCGTFYGHPAHLGAAGCVDDARALAAAPGFGARPAGAAARPPRSARRMRAFAVRRRAAGMRGALPRPLAPYVPCQLRNRSGTLSRWMWCCTRWRTKAAGPSWTR